MKTILIIGAGKTGRGFIPQYIQDSQIYFADKNEELIYQMKKTNNYKIQFYGNTQKEIIIHYEDAFYIKSHDFYHLAKTVDQIYISIDVSHYDELKEDLDKALLKREKPLVIITFENAPSASQKLLSILSKDISCSITLLDGGVFCTTNESDDLNIISQDLCYLPIQSCQNIDLPLFPVTPIQDFKSLMERKLYTYNCLSAVICYQGYIYHYEDLGDAAHDQRIILDIQTLLKDLDMNISHEFQIPLEEQRAFSQSAVDKFSDCFLKDSIQRNARNVIRKLGVQERLLKPLQIITDKNAQDVLFKTIACACYYDLIEETHQGIDLLKELDLSNSFQDKIKFFYKQIQEFI